MNKRESLVQPPTPPSRLEKLFLKLAPLLILVAATLLTVLIVQISKTSEEVKATSAYTRATNCIVAKNAVTDGTRQDEIEKCYVQVEKSTGVSLERFDEQTK